MSKSEVAIIGAGIQGVCNALFLQKKGIDVTLFDKDEPGCAASYGNAGHFSPYASLQLNRSDVLSDVPAMLLSSRGPLALKWNYFVKMIPWFSKYIMSCSEKKMMHTAKYMHQILDISLDAYDELFADINLDGLVEKKGISLALSKFKEADLNIVVVDNSNKKISGKIRSMINKDSIVLLNKSDVQAKENHKFDVDAVLASVKDNKNIDKLINLIKQKLNKKFSSNNSALITRERHRVKLNECLKEIDKFLKKDQNKDLELAAEDLRMATRHLGSIVGKVDVEEILGSIFKDFCIGK